MIERHVKAKRADGTPIEFTIIVPGEPPPPWRVSGDDDGVTVTDLTPCPRCNGTGDFFEPIIGDGLTACPDCDGLGYAKEPRHP